MKDNGSPQTGSEKLIPSSAGFSNNRERIGGEGIQAEGEFDAVARRFRQPVADTCSRKSVLTL
jgi:hypothetical protein